MARGFVVALVALAGLLCAAAIGYAAYAVSRGSVAVPVTRLQPTPTGLTPARVERPRTPTVETTTTSATTTGEDHRGRGGGDDHSGRGGGDD